MKFVSAALVACAGLWLTAARVNGQLPATSPPPLLADQSPTASILFADGRSLPIRSHGGDFPLVIGYAGQNMIIQCRIPAAIASRLVIQSLDGGTISTPSSVAADGTVDWQFQPGTQPGLYRILVSFGNLSATLQFWVPTPDDNPPVLIP